MSLGPSRSATTSSLGAILFALSVVGIFLNRKNLIVLLMAIELMLLAVNLNFVAFSHYLGDMAGQVFVFFILTVAAAESAIGLAILVVLFRNRVDDQRRRTRRAQGLRVVNACSATLSRIRLAARRPARAAGRRRSSPACSAKQIGRAGAHSRDDPRRAGLLHHLGHDVLYAVVADGARFNGTVYTWMTRRRPEDGDRLPDRRPDGDDDVRRDLRVADGAHLHHRLHGRRPGLPALLHATSRCSRSRC